MLLEFPLLVIFLNYLLLHFEILVMSEEVKKEERALTRKIRQFGEIKHDWIKDILNINKELLDVQAIIAKDEESKTNCMTGSRKTNKRHLMCAGAIVNVQHVLTSATCIQEATFIRHNLRAPLVVVVGILKSKPQVIRVNSYKIHPKHIEFPYDPQHSKHNVAVIKLSCRIATEHFTPIELPEESYTELCMSDSCLVAIIRKVGETSHVIYDTWAKHIPTSTRKRRSTETTIELQNNSTSFKIQPANIQEKLRKTLRNPHPRSLKLQGASDILPNNITQTVLGPSKIEKSMSLKNAKEKRNYGHRKELVDNVPVDSPSDNSGLITSDKRNSENVETMKNFVLGMQDNSTLESNIPIEDSISDVIEGYDLTDNHGKSSNKGRIFSPRASDGFQGCAQSGSPVMLGKVQAALVSVSCDDRQPATVWNYTDIFINIDWIMKEAGIVKMSPKTVPNNTTTCSTCIYNFFIDLTGNNEPANCTEFDRISERSPNYKSCALNSGQSMKNNLRSVIMNKSNYLPNDREFSEISENSIKDRNSNFPLDLPKNVFLQTRQFGNNGDKLLQIGEDRKSPYTEQESTHDNGKTSRKDFTKMLSKHDRKESNGDLDIDFQKSFNFNTGKVKSRDFTGIPQIDFDRRTHKDFGLRSNKNFDTRSYKNDTSSRKNFDARSKKNFSKIVRNFKKSPDENFNGDNDERVRKHFQGDYYGKYMKMKNENRLRKHVVNDQILKNEPRVLDNPRLKTTNFQQSIDYNPLAKKFHNLRLLLARIQKLRSKKEFINSLQGNKYVKREKSPSILDKR